MNIQMNESPRLMTIEEGLAFRKEVLARKFWFDSINLAAGKRVPEEIDFLVIMAVSGPEA
jgi:hypothetical protein